MCQVDVGLPASMQDPLAVSARDVEGAPDFAGNLNMVNTATNGDADVMVVVGVATGLCTCRQCTGKAAQGCNG